MKRRPKKPKKAAPSFASEDEERKFWAKHDATEYFDWDRAVQPKLTELKPSTRSISLRLPLSMLEELEVLANQMDVHYQSLMKIYLAERIESERRRKAS